MSTTKLTQHLNVYMAAEGRAEAEEKVIDWLYYLHELASAGQNVAGVIVNIEIACARNGLDFKGLRERAKSEIGTRSTKQLA
jgi:hypothetical protein